MIALLNIRGYVAPDPLDALRPKQRFLLSSATTFAVTAPLLFVVYDVLHIATLHPSWLMYIELLAAAFVYAPLVLLLRKWSSLLQMAVLALPFSALDIVLEAHVRAVGGTAPWMYDPDGLLGSLQPLLRILIVWIGDAFVMGSVALWLSRMIAAAWTRSGRSAPGRDETPELFHPAWSVEEQPRAPLDFGGFVLRAIGLAYLSYVVLLASGLLGVAVFPGPVRELLGMTYQNPALAIHTLIKILLVVDLAFLGAYNRELRFHTATILFGAHLVSTAASLAFWLLSAHDDPHREFLLASVVADALMGGFLGWVAWRHRAFAARYALPREFPEFFSVPQRVMRIFWRSYAWGCAACAVGVLIVRFIMPPDTGLGAVFGYPDPQVSNTVTQFATLCLIGFMVCRREALRETLFVPVMRSLVVAAAAGLLWLTVSDAVSDGLVRTRTGRADVDWYFAFGVLASGGLGGLLAWLRRSYYDVDHGIVALSPAAARHVLALHEALFDVDTADGKSAALPAQVVQAIDRHVGSIRGRKRGLLNLPFFSLETLLVGVYGLRPHFSAMAPLERRAWLRRHVLRPPNERRRAFIPPLAEVAYRIGSAAHAFVSWAHYDQLGGRAAIGYVPPGARPRLQGRYASGTPPSLSVASLPRTPEDAHNFAPREPCGVSPLIAPRVVTPAVEPSLPPEVDYLILGSGAGGAVMAYRLAAATAQPDRILLVERGPRLSPPTEFGGSEMSLVRQLYKEGGLQQTRRFGLTILQGECVGGSTVINNGICTRIPDSIAKLWHEQFGTQTDKLEAAYDEVGRELGIGPVHTDGVNDLVRQAFERSTRPLIEAGELRAVELQSNHRNVLGTGLDNLGDQHLRKRSMLETYLPWAEGHGVRIASEVTGVRFSGDPAARRATHVLVRTGLGRLERVRVNKAIIVSGGVIASSHFLMRSGVRGWVGRNVSCNFALPAVLGFERALHAYDGLQITLGALDVANRAIFETYFNPPGAFALSIPFFFERHRELMQRYVSEINFGALVGSEPGGTVEARAHVLDGRAIDWRLAPGDVRNLKFALSTLVRLAHNAGARRITLRTEPGISFEPTESNCARFARALEAHALSLTDLALVTSHPQGGNRMAADGSRYASTRVVNQHFRLPDWDNVYVADASVFPTGITVNPQWTIFALASMAADSVIADQEGVAPSANIGRRTPKAAE
jgi:choline dehydrogenase-like flavoprotein